MKIVILAAGLSKRMGNENKLLLPFNSCTILETTINNALSFSSDVLIVLGHEIESVYDKIKNYPIDIIVNENYKEGQETSIRKALSILDENIIILPGDMPFISKSEYVDICEKAKGKAAIRPIFNNEVGHPVFLSKEIVRKIKKSKKPVRSFIKDYYNGNENNIKDIDTKEEYTKL